MRIKCPRCKKDSLYSTSPPELISRLFPAKKVVEIWYCQICKKYFRRVRKIYSMKEMKLLANIRPRLLLGKQGKWEP